ncbi:transposase [Belnapia sp. T6]|uniref:Transposase n=1 Tax=Belnapia mucosa TaxID=2804532 RepID=A0ABS1VD05_9PROT|nr:transposase [Belnapia mucosa]
MAEAVRDDRRMSPLARSALPKYCAAHDGVGAALPSWWPLPGESRTPGHVTACSAPHGSGGTGWGTIWRQPLPKLRPAPALTITTALTLRAVFHLALRKTEGLTDAILVLLDLAVPDHITLSRRAETLRVPRSGTRLTDQCLQQAGFWQ